MLKEKVLNGVWLTSQQALACYRAEQKTYPYEFEYNDNTNYSEAQFAVSPFHVVVQLCPDEDADLSHYGQFMWKSDYSYKDEILYFDDEYNLPKLQSLAGHESSRQWWNGWPKYFVRGNPMDKKERQSTIEFWVRRGLTRHEADCRCRQGIWDDVKALLKIYDDSNSMIGISVVVSLEDEDEIGSASCWGFEIDNSKNVERQKYLMSEVDNLVQEALNEAVRELPKAVQRTEEHLTRLKYHALMMGTKQLLVN